MPGFVGILHVDLHLPAAGSLKEKRKELRRVKAWMTKGGYAVAETGYHDLWQRAALVLSAPSESPGDANERLDAASRRLHCDPVALVAGEARQVVRAPELWDDDPAEEAS